MLRDCIMEIISGKRTVVKAIYDGVAYTETRTDDELNVQSKLLVLAEVCPHIYGTSVYAVDRNGDIVLCVSREPVERYYVDANVMNTLRSHEAAINFCETNLGKNYANSIGTAFQEMYNEFCKKNAILCATDSYAAFANENGRVHKITYIPCMFDGTCKPYVADVFKSMTNDAVLLSGFLESCVGMTVEDARLIVKDKLSRREKRIAAEKVKNERYRILQAMSPMFIGLDKHIDYRDDGFEITIVCSSGSSHKERVDVVRNGGRQIVDYIRASLEGTKAMKKIGSFGLYSVKLIPVKEPLIIAIFTLKPELSKMQLT